MRNLLSIWTAVFGLLTCSFGAINAVNGVTASTSSNINGVTNPSAVNGQTLASGGGGTPARIANVKASAVAPAVGTVTTSSVDTTGASLIIIAAAHYNATTAEVTPSDNKGNTWTAGGNDATPGVAFRARFYYCINPTVGSGHTFTIAGTDTYPAIFVEAWSGLSGATLDQANFNYSASATSITAGNINPTTSSSIYFSCSANSGTISGVTVSTLGNSAANIAANSVGGGISYSLRTDNSSITSDWSFTGSVQGVCRSINFKF